MTFWLIIFVFASPGDLVEKREIHVSSKTMCELVMQSYNPDPMFITKMICVSNDHHEGISKDAGVEYDVY